MRKSFVAAALTASALVLTSCAMPADDPNFAGEVEAGGQIDEVVAEANAADQAALDDALVAPTSVGVDAPLSATPEAGLSIVSLTDGTEYGAVFEASLAEAGSALGWTVESVPVDIADPMAVAEAFDAAVASAPAGIHVTGAMADALAASLPAAQTAGIPVICTGCSSVTPVDGITDASIDGTEQNTLWANVLASYVVDNQASGEDAGVQYFSLPGGALADFNLEFSTSLLDQCRNCSASESIVDPTMMDITDSASVAAFITGEMSLALGSWALLDSGALSATVADSLADDPMLLSPVVLLGRGATAADIESLMALGGGPAPAEPEAAPSADDAAAEDVAAADAEGDAEFAATRSPEEAAGLQAWIGISQPVMAWRVADQFARLIGGDAPSTGPIPSQLLTGATVAEAVLDETGNYVGVADYKEQFAALWGLK